MEKGVSLVVKYEWQCFQFIMKYAQMSDLTILNKTKLK